MLLPLLAFVFGSVLIGGAAFALMRPLVREKAPVFVRGWSV